MFATIRLGLMDNIENPQFKVQKDGYSDFYDVSADLMKENYDDNGDQPVQTTAPAQTTAQTTTTTKKTTTTTTTKKADEDSSELESSLAETTTTTTAKASDESVKGLELYDENGSRIDNESSAVCFYRRRGSLPAGVFTFLAWW